MRGIGRLAAVQRWLVYAGGAAFGALIAFAVYWMAVSSTPGQKLPSPGDTAAIPMLKLPAASIAAGALPLLALLLFVVWHRNRPQALARRFTTHETPSRSVGFAAVDRLLFVDAGLSRHFQALRRHAEVPSDAIDVQRTLHATIRAGGRVELRYGTRRRLADYLLLIDRVSSSDHLVALADVLTRRMTEELIPFTAYDFQGDPRWARRRGATAPVSRIAELADLAALHGDQPLILFTDASAFFQPVSDQPQPWVQRLLDWPLVVVFTPKPNVEWAEREKCLQALGFMLLPTTSAGVMALADRLRAGGQQPARLAGVDPRSRRLWQLLDARPERWLRRTAPDTVDVDTLTRLLRDTLGEHAFEVLCATAVFPAIDADITLWLADALGRQQHGRKTFDESSFGQLARLPWLRRGTMPDWLRVTLINQMPPQRQAEVRRLCLTLLKPVDAAGDRFQLDIARGDEALWIATLFAALRADSRSPLHDRLFLGFLRHDGSRPLALDAPATLSRLLRPKFALAEFGAAALAVLGAAAILWFHVSLQSIFGDITRLLAGSRLGSLFEAHLAEIRMADVAAMIATVAGWSTIAFRRTVPQRRRLEWGVRLLAGVAVSIGALLLLAVPRDQGGLLVLSFAPLCLSLTGTGQPDREAAPGCLPLLRDDAWVWTSLIIAAAVAGIGFVSRTAMAISPGALAADPWRTIGAALSGGTALFVVPAVAPLAALVKRRLQLDGATLGLTILGAVTASVFATGLGALDGMRAVPSIGGNQAAIAANLLPLAALWGASVMLWRRGKTSLAWLQRLTVVTPVAALLVVLMANGATPAFVDAIVSPPLLLFGILAWPPAWDRATLVRMTVGAALVWLPGMVGTTAWDAVDLPVLIGFALVRPALRIARPPPEAARAARMPRSASIRPPPPAATVVTNRWAQLALGMACMALIANLQYGWTLFVNPMEQEHHFGLSAIQLAFSIFVIVETWLVPVEGWLADRFGPGPVIVAGGLLAGLGWVGNAYASSIAELYAAAVVAGVGAGCVYGACVGNAVKWFPDRRGLAAGLTAAGFGVGASITVIPIAHMIQDSGYEQTFIFFGILQGGCLAVLGSFIGVPTDRATSGRASRLLTTTVDYTTWDMLRTPTFWLSYALFVAVAVSGLIATAQIGPMAKDYGLAQLPVSVFGLTLPLLTMTLAIDNLANGFTRPLCGAISDRIGRENTMFVVFIGLGLALLGMWKFGHDQDAFMTFAALIFLFWGEIYSIFPALCADTFGTRHATANCGALYTAKGTASLLVPLASILSEGGNWDRAFTFSAVVTMAAGVAAAFLLAPMRRRTIAAANANGEPPPA